MKKVAKTQSKKVAKIGGIVAWIVATFKPDYHLAKNPPKGNKRKVAKPRKETVVSGDGEWK